MEITPEDFIISQGICAEDVDYQIAEQLIENIADIAMLTEKCTTIFDYFKNEYLYISDHPVFFPKSSRNSKLDYRLLFNNSDEEGIFLMHTIQQRAIRFLRNQPQSERTNYIFSLNVVMLNGDTRIDSLYKVKPQVLDKKGNIWLSMAILEEANCFIKPSVRNFKTNEIHYFKPIKRDDIENISKKLSRQEHVILTFMAEGKSAKEICAELEIKEPTYKRHRSEIYSKLGVSSKISAINRAYIYGIIS